MAEKTSKGRTAYDPPRFLPLADGVALGDARDAVQKIGLVTADSPETDFIRFFETQNGALYRRDIVRWSNDKLVDAGHYKGRKLLVWLDLSLKMHRFTSETEQVLLAEVTASSPFAFEKTATFLLLGYSPSEDWPEQLENLCISDPPSLFETARKTLDLPVPGAPVLDEFKPSPGEDLLDISRKVIGRQAYRMKANTPGAILAGDPEFVHDLRVATRRARFALRMMRPFFGDDCERLRKELKWLADVLGDVRDCDVMTENLHEPLGRTENLLSGQDRFLAYLENQRIPARKRLKEALVSSRYEKLLNDLFELYRSPSPQLPPEKRPTRNYASKLIRKAGRKVRKSLGGLADPPSSEQLHEVRIAVKRLRYTCEYFKVLYRGKLRDTIKDCKLVQDCLGEHQDAAVAIGALKDIAQALSSERENTQAVMVTGALLEMQRRRVLERRELALPLLEDFAKRVAALAKLL